MRTYAYTPVHKIEHFDTSVHRGMTNLNGTRQKVAKSNNTQERSKLRGCSASRRGKRARHGIIASAKKILKVR